MEIYIWIFLYINIPILYIIYIYNYKPLYQYIRDTSILSLQSRLTLFATPCTIAHQVPLSMGFSRQEYWMGLPFPPPGDLPDPGIKLVL